MEMQIKKIKEFNWDILIILDACRADIFEELALDFIEHDSYQRVNTGDATYTRKWLYRTWSDNFYKDIHYISANGFVNSKGIVLENIPFPFNAKNHFGKIYDVWDYGWNKKTGRVEPHTVTKYAKEFIDDKYKYIVHYQQPHAPYLFPDGGFGGFRNVDKIRNKKWKTGEEKFKSFLANKSRFHVSFFMVLRMLARRFIPHTLQWKLVNTFPKIGKYIMSDRRKYKSMWENYGKKGIIDAYKRNLKDALPHVKDLIDAFPNHRIVITADHGERLGERGMFGHGGRPVKETTEVPWMVINPKDDGFTDEDKKLVESRLRDLGYFE